MAPLLSSACQQDESAIQLLLKDPRVDGSLADENRCTPLWWASFWGQLEVVELLIASGKNLGDVNQKGVRNNDWEEPEEYTALEIAREWEKKSTKALLERLLANPAQTRQHF